jgi:hypothetical protein
MSPAPSKNLIFRKMENRADRIIRIMNLKEGAG